MMRKSGGCRVWGEFNVKKLNGNFNFAMGKKIFMQGRHVHSFDIGSVGKWNITHKFHNLQFGPSFPGQKNQLNSFSQILTKKDHSAAFSYDVQVVPVHHKSILGY